MTSGFGRSLKPRHRIVRNSVKAGAGYSLSIPAAAISLPSKMLSARV